MKKTILLSVFLIGSLALFAQNTPVIDPSIFDVIYNWIIGYIPVKTLTIILTVGWILEYVITYVKWTPANSTVAFIWNVLKKIIYFIANKKK